MSRTGIEPWQFQAVRYVSRSAIAVQNRAGAWIGGSKAWLRPEQLHREEEVYRYWRYHASKWGDVVSMADFDLDAVTLLGKLALEDTETSG